MNNMDNMDNYRVMYLRNVDGHAIGCLAIQVNHKQAMLQYGYSVLNPADKFDRKVARQLALGRLMESPIEVSVMREDLNMHEITRSIMRSLVLSNKTPARAVRAAKLWLNFVY